MGYYIWLVFAVIVAVYLFAFFKGKETGRSEMSMEMKSEKYQVERTKEEIKAGLESYQRGLEEYKDLLIKKGTLEKVLVKLERRQVQLKKLTQDLRVGARKELKNLRNINHSVQEGENYLQQLRYQYSRLKKQVDELKLMSQNLLPIQEEVAQLRKEQVHLKHQQESFDLEKAQVRLFGKEIDDLSEKLNEQSRMISELNYQFGESYIQGRGWLASMISQYLTIKDDYIADYLKNKKNPAVKASEEVKRLNTDKRELIRQLKILEFTLLGYKEKFPFLIEYEDEILNEEIQNIEEIRVIESNQDAVKKYLSRDEYQDLSSTERNQLALDRYLNGNLSKANIGRLYERYIRWQYEQQGFKVEYHGIVKGFEDLGRDLICRKDKIIHIVQAKCWSESKQIHENHICQLFGTVSHFKQNTPELADDVSIHMVLVTSTKLSEVARLMADALGVEYREEHKLDKSYPMIKCNINRNTGEKIYHLPFDQMYDRVIIKAEEGELYAGSVFEAEFHGFRRAFKYRG